MTTQATAATSKVPDESRSRAEQVEKIDREAYAANMDTTRRAALMLGVSAVVATRDPLASSADSTLDLRAECDRLTAERDAARQALIEHMATHAAGGHKPISYPDAETARRALRVPADANLVTWSHGNATLEEVFMTLGENDILVLPERPVPYLVDSSDGFRAADVSAVAGVGGAMLSIVSTYKGRRARTWFAMARARRGILGLGPGAVITTTDSGFRQPPQIPDKNIKVGDPGRFYWDAAGIRRSELVGCAEKIIEAEHDDAYYGNFTMTGRDFGGVAYHALAMRGGTHERVHHIASWRGFSAVPNGEAGAVMVNRGRYLIANSTLDPLDPATGTRVGTSPFMINNSPGGRIEQVTADQCVKGMPTWWSCSGLHQVTNLDSRWNHGPGINLEKCDDGFELRWTGGNCWPNRAGGGGHPAPDGVHGNGMHIGLDARGEATITLEDVDLDTSLRPGALCVQGYGGTTANEARISITATRDGKRVPVALYD